MEEFLDTHLQYGWEIISSIVKILFVITILTIWIFLDNQHPFYQRGVYALPMALIMFFIMDWIYSYNKKTVEKLLLASVFMIGFIVIRGNLRKDSYYFNEFWVLFIIYVQFIAFFLFLRWKRVLISFYVISVIYFVLMNWFYNDIPFLLYVVFIVLWILLPTTLYLFSQKMIEMFILLKTNKELIHTIRSILQIFPEGVIIRSIDPVTNQTVIKFANDVANQFLNKINENVEFIRDLKVSKLEPIHQNYQDFQYLESFLSHQELNININKFESSSQIVEIREWSQNIEEIKEFSRDTRSQNQIEALSEFFNIKSIRVEWENLDSYLHVFINTTQVFLNL